MIVPKEIKEKAYYTSTEYCAKYSIDRSTLYRHCQKGLIEFIYDPTHKRRYFRCINKNTLCAKEASRVLGVSLSGVYNLVHKQSLTAIRKNPYLFAAEDLALYRQNSIAALEGQCI